MGTDIVKMTTFPAKTSLSARLLLPKSSKIPAANSTRYPIATIFKSSLTNALSMPVFSPI